MMKYFRTFSIICIAGLLYSSCVKKANYPDVPVITFNSFVPFGSGTVTDSAYLRLNFTDGNGDIGYPSQQTGVSPDLYALPLVYNSHTNTYDTLLDVSGKPNIFKYNIPDITPAGSDKELNGIIQINFEGFLQQNITIPWSDSSSQAEGFVYYKLQFVVWMYDRAGNKSNVLTTPTCQIYPYPSYPN